MINKIEKIKSWHIVAFTAAMLIAVFLSVNFADMLTEKTAARNGSYKHFTMSPEEFTFDGIEKTLSGYKTTYDDAKLIFEEQMKVSTVRFTAEYSISPGEIVLYYKEPGDTEYSSQKRRWAFPDDTVENGYIIIMPMKEVTRIRIDPTMYRGNEMKIGEFEFNREKSFDEYFDIEYTDVYNLIVYTALISACLKYRQEFILRKFD